MFDSTTPGGAAADRGRTVAHRNDHTEVSLLQQRRLTFSDRPATTASRGFLQRAVVSSGVHKGCPVLCVGWCHALQSGGGGFCQRAAAPTLTFQPRVFNLSKRPAADLRSSSTSMLPRLSATDPSAGNGVVMSGGGAVTRRLTETRERLRFSHTLYWDGNQAGDLLSSCLPPLRHVLIEIHPITKRSTVIRTPWISQRLLRRPSDFSQSQSFANTEK